MEFRSSAPALLAIAVMQATPATPLLPATPAPVQPPVATPVQAPAAAPAQTPAAAPGPPITPAPVQPTTPPAAVPNAAGSAQPFPAVPGQFGAAQPNPNQLTITGLGGGSAQWTILVLLTFLTLIPSILICMTPFARLLIVFHFLRQALGLQTTPSNQTLIGLSVIMTFFIMQPIGAVIYRDSVVPLQAGKITAVDALTKAATPMREFMSHYVREKDAALFLEMAKEPRPANIGDLSFRVLLPAYILSELKAGFQIGAVLFLPFLVVDMVVASITTSVGMMQLPPVVISTPLKLLLFLMVDGWHLLIGALMRSFN
jgi:flagellar biosynthetic protein FliP